MLNNPAETIQGYVNRRCERAKVLREFRRDLTRAGMAPAKRAKLARALFKGKLPKPTIAYFKREGLRLLEFSRTPLYGPGEYNRYSTETYSACGEDDRRFYERESAYKSAKHYAACWRYLFKA